MNINKEEPKQLLNRPKYIATDELPTNSKPTKSDESQRSLKSNKIKDTEDVNLRNRLSQSIVIEEIKPLNSCTKTKRNTIGEMATRYSLNNSKTAPCYAATSVVNEEGKLCLPAVHGTLPNSRKSLAHCSITNNSPANTENSQKYYSQMKNILKTHGSNRLLNDHSHKISAAADEGYLKHVSKQPIKASHRLSTTLFNDSLPIITSTHNSVHKQSQQSDSLHVMSNNKRNIKPIDINAMPNGKWNNTTHRKLSNSSLNDENHIPDVDRVAKTQFHYPSPTDDVDELTTDDDDKEYVCDTLHQVAAAPAAVSDLQSPPPDSEQQRQQVMVLHEISKLGPGNRTEGRQMWMPSPPRIPNTRLTRRSILPHYNKVSNDYTGNGK